MWKVWIVRPLNARIVSSTKPDSFSVSVWIATCTSISSATERQLSIAAGVVPQSSWSLSPIAPALHLLAQRLGQAHVAFAEEAEVHRETLRPPQSIESDVPRPGRARRRVRARRGPRSAAEHRGDAAHERFFDLLRADEVDVRVDAARA